MPGFECVLIVPPERMPGETDSSTEPAGQARGNKVIVEKTGIGTADAIDLLQLTG